MATDNGIRKEVNAGELKVSRLFKNTYQKENTMTAELRQSVVTDSFYPAAQVQNDMQDNIFGTEDFGFSETKYSNTENRVSWIDVPANSTLEQVSEKLASFEKANLYRFLSNHPILTSSQKSAIDSGITTKDIIAESQVVRYPEGTMQNGEDVGLQLALDPNGKPQYRAVFFSKEGKEDTDNRSNEAEDFYTTDKISAEMATVSEQVVADQTITM